MNNKKLEEDKELKLFVLKSTLKHDKEVVLLVIAAINEKSDFKD